MAQFNDKDPLDMNGEWDIFYRNNEDPTFTFPEGETFVSRLKLKATGDPATGQKFTGKMINPKHNPIEYSGQTVYRKRGRQVLQMMAIFEPDQWVQAHAGQHQRHRPTGKGRVEILGVAIDCGGALGPKGESIAPRSFKMVKVTTK